jgi:tetratricopeptide (TPR) repeat protein
VNERKAAIRGAAAALAIGLGGAALAQHGDAHDPRALEADPRTATGPIAPVLEGMGEHHRKVTTKSERAQRFFDQGLSLAYGFNHPEALRSFKEAARLDPECAMAYWGWALVLGPNINLPMQAEVVSQAHQAIQTGMSKRAKATRKERELIEALALRYTDDPAAERAPLDAAYAEAMRRLHGKYPDDADVATLFAAARMEQWPWDYWTRDGRPKRKETRELLAALESAMVLDPHHEGALHYWIHAVEAVDPDRGEKAADTLRGLAPGAGHLVHMPSHIYIQLGRYAEAYEANAQAAKTDEGYIAQCRAQGIYPLNYYPHNVHFQVWAALLQGQGALALADARKVASNVPPDHHGNVWALYETFLGMPLVTLVRFGKWEEILREPRPPETARYVTGLWHYARALASVHTGRLDQARAERAELAKLAEDPATSKIAIGFSDAGMLLTIAGGVVSGELAAKEGRWDEAASQLERAVRLQDSLAYTEPPDWYYPVRHTLGAVLLEAGRPREAEVVYWRDLEKHRDNGWALYGLWQAVRAQGRNEEAAAIEERFRAAWSRADVTLTSSRF